MEMEFIVKDIPKIGRNKYNSTASATIYSSSGNSGTVSGSSVYVYNGLDSENASWALSANMGKLLQDSKADKTELHNHTNKAILDNIQQTNIDNWTAGYVHSLLTGGVHITSAERTN
jgi:hypothetical protein